MGNDGDFILRQGVLQTGSAAVASLLALFLAGNAKIQVFATINVAGVLASAFVALLFLAARQRNRSLGRRS